MLLTGRETSRRLPGGRATEDLDVGDRYPVQRPGPRPPIPLFLRVAIYRRDGDACQLCGTFLPGPGPDKQIGCVLPWSANGALKSTNLRVVCAWCTDVRSNFVDVRDYRQLRPVTWWCPRCWGPETWNPAPWTDRYGPPGWRTNQPLIDPEVPDDVPVRLAYCALCEQDEYTPDRALTGKGTA